jgi:heme/copper-type cytochrome/quinol oxidase subunit 2
MKGICVAALAILALAAPIPVPQSRECDIVARDFSFSPERIEIRQNDLVRIRFRADDIPHAIAIDEYRINKRAGIGQTIVVEFRADRAGRFPIYCSLTADDRCRRMRGELIVTP